MDYRWWVFLHIVGVFGFLMAHGVSVTVAFRMRKERDRAKLQDLKALSGSSLMMMYISLGVLLLFGVIAGFAGHWWGHWWIWVSLGILVALIAEMSAVSRPYYEKVIEATQMRESGVPRVSDEELDELLRSPLPMINAAIGFAGLLAIMWLMIFKPGT